MSALLAEYFSVATMLIITPSPIHRGTGYCFRSISLFISLFICIFLCFFVSKIMRKRLDRFARHFQRRCHRCGMTMARPYYIFGQFRETARCRNVQHGVGVCCAFAPQLVVFCPLFIRYNGYTNMMMMLIRDCIGFHFSSGKSGIHPFFGNRPSRAPRSRQISKQSWQMPVQQFQLITNKN